MASLEHTTSSPKSQSGDRDFDMTHASADRPTSQERWVGGLPPDIWLCILDQLCPHCRPGPVLKPGVVFMERTNGSMIPGPVPQRSKLDLLSMTMTCRRLRDLAQSYLFHCCDSLSGYSFLHLRKTVARRPDLATGIKKIAVSSDTYQRCFLARLSNVRTLNFGIRPFLSSKQLKYRSPAERLVPVGCLEKLGHLTIKPLSGYSTVDTAHGRLWLETLMHAAPELRSLCCYRFTDFTCRQPNQDIVFPVENASPNYAGLPENKITSLRLLQTWFRFEPLKQLLGNFKELREFSLLFVSQAVKNVIRDQRVRPVDGHDVVTLLEPLKHQLEVLALDFRGYPRPLSFRSILSLSAFTTLKRIRLCNMSIDMLPGQGQESWEHMTEEELETYSDDHLEDRKAVLVNLLPCKSLEFLQLDDFDGWFEPAVVELARHASRGEFPNLKRVRLHGGISWGLDGMEGEPFGPGVGEELLQRDMARYHDLVSTVPEKYRDEAEVDRAMLEPELEREARKLFSAAGVLFERLCVTWPSPADDDSNFKSGWMRSYPTACAGDCGNPDCIVVRSTP